MIDLKRTYLMKLDQFKLALHLNTPSFTDYFILLFIKIRFIYSRPNLGGNASDVRGQFLSHGNRTAVMETIFVRLFLLLAVNRCIIIIRRAMLFCVL